MLASSLAHSIRACISIYGDRDLMYMGKIKDGRETFYEDITTIHFSNVINGVPMTAKELKEEPFVLTGNSGFIRYEQSIKLNWFGRIIKSLVTKK